MNIIKEIAFVDLFAGIGGMRLAFEKYNCSCSLTCEIDPYALRTYKLNFQENQNHVYHNDLLTLDFSSIKKYDILLAGFPCQPYSIAGLRKGLDDNRGGEIFNAMIQMLKINQPKAFLLENVRGLKSHDGGKTLQYMITKLEDCGYKISGSEVLNSMDHANIPQNRERLFIVGFKNKSKAKLFNFPPKEPLTKKIMDMLQEPTKNSHYYYSDRYPKFPEIKKGIEKKDTLYQWRRVYVRENKSKACPALTANMGTGGHNIPLLKNDYGIRKLTPKEVANFQGFPNNYIFPKDISENKIYKQLGNSVTVPLIERFAKEIIRVLLK
jgi:DNA (cytosine-5)-methyltransferase 1